MDPHYANTYQSCRSLIPLLLEHLIMTLDDIIGDGQGVVSQFY